MSVPTPTFQAAIARGKLLLAVVHLRPLPGSPRNGEAPASEATRAEPTRPDAPRAEASLSEKPGAALGAGEGTIAAIADAARRDAETIMATGFDGYIIENFGDAPFFAEDVPPHVVAAMTRIALALPREGAVVGVNVLRNDARAALGIAAACGLQAIRVNVHVGAVVADQGIVEGRAALTTRERRLIAPDVAILADVKVKHAVPLGVSYDLRSAARDTAYRGLADALIVTGSATGEPASMEDLRVVRDAVPDRPVIVGSGVTTETVREILELAGGIIVGSAIERDGRAGNPVDFDRALSLVREARR